jgi:putative flippase GtrA
MSTPGFKKLVKYTAVSAITMAISLAIQAICFGHFGVRAGMSAVIANVIGAIPSYYLNRSWVWKKSGRSHLAKEVVPFWSMALIGLVASTVASDQAEDLAIHMTNSHSLRTVIVTGASFVAYAILWVLKFLLFNRLFFVHHPEDLDPALDGRTGLPT